LADVTAVTQSRDPQGSAVYCANGALSRPI